MTVFSQVEAPLRPAFWQYSLLRFAVVRQLARRKRPNVEVTRGIVYHIRETLSDGTCEGLVNSEGRSDQI